MKLFVSAPTFPLAMQQFMGSFSLGSVSAFFQFLGGEKTLKVTKVYFVRWMTGRALPRMDKLELLLAQVSDLSWRKTLVEAYLESACREMPTVRSILKANDFREELPAVPFNEPSRRHLPARTLTIDAAQMSYLAGDISRYLVFSILLARTTVGKPTSRGLLAKLTELAASAVDEILNTLERMKLCIRGEGGWETAGDEIHWASSADSHISTKLLNEYDSLIHGKFQNRVRCKVDQYILPDSDIEHFSRELSLLEEKFYNRQTSVAQGSKVMMYRTETFASDRWINAEEGE